MQCFLATLCHNRFYFKHKHCELFSNSEFLLAARSIEILRDKLQEPDVTLCNVLAATVATKMLRDFMIARHAISLAIIVTQENCATTAWRNNAFTRSFDQLNNSIGDLNGQLGA